MLPMFACMYVRTYVHIETCGQFSLVFKFTISVLQVSVSSMSSEMVLCHCSSTKCMVCSTLDSKVVFINWEWLFSAIRK